jgi:hypothetical protein
MLVSRSIGFVGIVCLMALGCATKESVSDAEWRAQMARQQLVSLRLNRSAPYARAQTEFTGGHPGVKFWPNITRNYRFIPFSGQIWPTRAIIPCF